MDGKGSRGKGSPSRVDNTDSDHFADPLEKLDHLTGQSAPPTGNGSDKACRAWGEQEGELSRGDLLVTPRPRPLPRFEHCVQRLSIKANDGPLAPADDRASDEVWLGRDQLDQLLSGGELIRIATLFVNSVARIEERSDRIVPH